MANYKLFNEYTFCAGITLWWSIAAFYSVYDLCCGSAIENNYCSVSYTCYLANSSKRNVQLHYEIRTNSLVGGKECESEFLKNDFKFGIWKKTHVHSLSSIFNYTRRWFQHVSRTLLCIPYFLRDFHSTLSNSQTRINHALSLSNFTRVSRVSWSAGVTAEAKKRKC